jgi:myo-inositol-1-phosphate synthase
MSDKKIKIAIIGVGNCCSSLVQGIELSKISQLSGVKKVLGGYKVSDIDIVGAFDIDVRKVGQDLHEAIFQYPNCTEIFHRPNRSSKVIVEKTEVMDGISEHLKNYPEAKRIVEGTQIAIDLSVRLKELSPDFLISYLPVGSEKMSEYVAESCIRAGVNFINAIPVFICSNKSWRSRFKDAGLICIGDDIKSQIGATIIHRTLSRLLNKRGVVIDNTYQLNVGGNTDFLNMLNRNRLESKKISKTQSVTSQIEHDMSLDNVHIGPSDYIPFLNDNKIAFIYLEGKLFGGQKMTIDLKLSVEDSPNSAGSMIDAIRLGKKAIENNDWELVDNISALYFKSPNVQVSDDELWKFFED